MIIPTIDLSQIPLLERAAALLGALAQTSGSSDDRLFEIMI